MTLDSLKVFCDVVRVRSFSRGASVNRISQSAASQAVLQIEKRLGVQLIDRSKRPFALTDAGRVFYEGCRDVVDRYVAIESRTRSLHEDALCRVTVASIYSVGLYDMNQYVRRFRSLYPSGDVTIAYLHPAEVYTQVREEQADLGLVSFARPVRDLVVTPWRDEPFVLVCPPTHPLAGQPGVRLFQISGEPFVGFDTDLAVRRNIDRYLRLRGIEPDVAMTFDNIEAIKRGIEEGAGVSLLPEPTVRREAAAGTLAVVRPVDLDLVRPLSVIHRRRRQVTPGMTTFIRLLQESGGNGAASLTDRPSGHDASDDGRIRPEPQPLGTRGVG